MNSLKQHIEEQIQQTLAEYKTRHTRMISDFQRENGLTQDYNGRQLYELLQNADDAKAKSVSIELDENSMTFAIANNGNKPFDQKGFDSLMMSDLTSKVKKSYIGNKGLGFRSIISWADYIIIESNNLRVKFSQKIASNNFESLFNQEKKDRKLEERNFNKAVKPFPFLSIPEIEEHNYNDWWTTKISINFQSKPDVLEDIKSQIFSLNEEILLFLNHTRKLSFPNSKKKDLKKDPNGKHITINEKKWEIFERGEELPEEYQDKNSKDQNEHYNLKIAINDKKTKNINYLFSFFPTKVDIPFPVLIHGTFDLNNSRDQLRKSKKNEFVLEQLAELLINTAKDITQEEVSWKPLEILSYEDKNKNPVLDELDFYKKLDQSINKLKIFPCLDNKYRELSDVIFVDDDFSEYIEKVKQQALFPNLLKSKKEYNVNLSKFSIQNKIENIVCKINSLSKQIEAISDRVELIELVKRLFNDGNKYELLINEERRVISSDNDIYTPETQGGKDFYIPEYVQIDFLNKSFFDQLVKKYSLTDSNEKARDLQRKIKDIVDLHSYEPAQVLNKIITATNKSINTEPEKSICYIEEMVNALFLNFLELSELTKIPSDTKIMLINSKNELVDSKKLYLSKNFPSGNLVKDLFGDSLTEEQFLANITTFNLENDVKEDVEQFFLWLGVNKFLRITKVELNDDDYKKFVFQRIEPPWNCQKTKIKVNKIDPFDNIENFSKEKLILWILKDKRLYKQIDDLTNSDIFEHKSNQQGYYRTLSIKPSYILFQFFESNLLFDDYLITDKKYEWLNKFHFDYEHKLFKKYNITNKEMKPILQKLGAKEEFVDLSIARVTEILKDLHKSQPDGKLTQSIYKKAVKHYQTHKLKLKDPILFFAQKGNEKRYFKQENIFFSDNISLPKKLSSQYPILNYPPRAGAQNAITFFKINDLNNLDIKIISKSINQDKTTDFNKLFEKLKQFILAFRIEKLDNDQTKKNEASKLNKSKIYLCDDVQCIQTNTNFSLEDYEFFTEDSQIFFIQTPLSAAVKVAQKESRFCDSFSEIIANIFGIAGDKDKFRYVLRNDLEDTEHQIQNELGEHAMTEAKELLSYSNPMLSFWKAFYESLNKKFLISRKEQDVCKIVRSELNISNITIEHIDYENISVNENIPILTKLFLLFEIPLDKFNQNAFYKINLSEYHSKTIKNYFYKQEKCFRAILWKYLSTHTEKQSEFLSLIGEFEHNEDYILKFSRTNKKKFEIELEDIFKNFITERFPFIELCESAEHINNFDAIYGRNMDYFSEEDIETIDSEIKIQSLLYFNNEDSIEKVSKILNRKKTNQTKKNVSKNLSGHLINGFNYNSKSIPQYNSTKPYSYNPQNDKQKRKSGKIAEEIVFNKLVECHGKNFVSWKSKEDDSLHYDMRYSPDKGNQWKYVEVKSFSNDIFYLSKPEKDFGITNKENYEIWLVDGEYKIYPLKDFFLSNKYEMIAKDYIVSIEISEDSLITENVL